MGVVMNKPVWITEEYPSYDQIIKSFGHAIMDKETFGDYQGDYVYILKNKHTGEIGYIVIGYGSCSGCDRLQSAYDDHWHNKDEECDCDWEELIHLRDSIESGIHWEAPENRLIGNDWWLYDKELYEWLSKAYYNAKSIS